MATEYHTGKLWMAFVRKWANCDDFHGLTACVHMSICRPPCGITICNSKLLWLLEIETMLGQAFWQGKFSLMRTLASSPKREREEFAQLWQRCFFFSLLILGRSGFARDDNVHGPFSPEHINSNVPSVFFTRKRWNPRKHNNVAWGEIAPAMFCKCGI